MEERETELGIAIKAENAIRKRAASVSFCAHFLVNCYCSSLRLSVGIISRFEFELLAWIYQRSSASSVSANILRKFQRLDDDDDVGRSHAYDNVGLWVFERAAEIDCKGESGLSIIFFGERSRNVTTSFYLRFAYPQGFFVDLKGSPRSLMI